MPVAEKTLEQLDFEKAERDKEVRKKARFKDRKSVDNLISSILSLELFRERSKLQCMPDSFEDHEHYLRVMEPLYLHEVFSILTSSKRNIDVPQEQCESTKKKELKWTSILLREDVTETDCFVHVKLLDRLPTGNLPFTEGLPSPSQTAFKSLKESDLLIIAKADLAEGKSDIKAFMKPDWIADKLNRGVALLAYVHEKGRKGIPYLSLKLDSQGSKTFFGDLKNCLHLYCFFVESLSTVVREFRTMRMSEFYGAFSSTII